MNHLQRLTTPGRALLTALLLLANSLATAGEVTLYYHLDALGSPVAATDEAGNLKWREEYKPYGERINQEATAQANRRWYTGHPHDEATGLTYMGARYYDPVIGRFMAVDPVAFKEKNIYSFNRYSYAINNPYRNWDPDGRDTVAVGPTIRVPGWLGKLVYGEDFIGQGGSVGGALSFPGFFGGEWDFGVYWEGHAGGKDYGTGRYTIDTSYNKGSVRDLGGQGAQVGAHVEPYGASVNLDEKGEVSGVAVHWGAGYNVGGSGTLGNTGTIRDLVEWVRADKSSKKILNVD